ncbi:hypothetical protein [Streptococcus henryi]|uniref:hypothetical protein n=1 Tax=Streptococcus henryi TaxID=439219 RepID=UPI000363C103|nr:hypothetical protein [Streptococcus henryi]
MLNWILAALFSVTVMYALLKVTLYFAKKKTPSYKINKKDHNNYFIGFSDVEVPDIRQNEILMNNVMVKYNTKNGFAVSSKINDDKLKELLMNQYHLTPKQVQVTQGNLFI